MHDTTEQPRTPIEHGRSLDGNSPRQYIYLCVCVCVGGGGGGGVGVCVCCHIYKALLVRPILEPTHFLGIFTFFPSLKSDCWINVV